MCTELLLALIYFVTIFAVNFFLYKLLTTYVKNIFSLLKMKNIFNTFPGEEKTIFSLLSLYSKNPSKNRSMLLRLPNLVTSQDVLILGNIYRFLLSEKQKPEENKNSSTFYLQLLENQYLSKKITLK
jgi:hypothetical protein